MHKNALFIYTFIKYNKLPAIYSKEFKNKKARLKLFIVALF